MLRVTLTLIPKGDESRAQVLGVVSIANISAQPSEGDVFADYSVAMRGQQNADATLRGVPRWRSWRMVKTALDAVLDPEPAAPLALQDLRAEAQAWANSPDGWVGTEAVAKMAQVVLALLDVVESLPRCEGAPVSWEVPPGEVEAKPIGGCQALATLEYDSSIEGRRLWCDAHGVARFEDSLYDMTHAAALRRLLGLPPGTRGR